MPSTSSELLVILAFKRRDSSNGKINNEGGRTIVGRHKGNRQSRSLIMVEGKGGSDRLGRRSVEVIGRSKSVGNDNDGNERDGNSSVIEGNGREGRGKLGKGKEGSGGRVGNGSGGRGGTILRMYNI